MTYGDYLQLDTILASQKRLSNHHDEMLFIIIHQVSELWLKLVIHEIQAATKAIGQDQFREAFKMLARVTRIQEQLVEAWEVLSDRKSTRLNSSHVAISYAVFCLKKKRISAKTLASRM